MAEPTATESPIDAAAGAAGHHATEAFALLGNETRLAILLALWDGYDPHGRDNAMPFSEIFDRVDYDDPGNLNYHLDQLEGQFIRRRAEGDGYELRTTARRFIHAVIAGAGVQDAAVEATEIDQPCPFCDAPTEIRYSDGLVRHSCTECEGVTTAGTEDGFLNAVPLDPAGLADRTAEEIRAASRVAAWRQTQIMFDGLCPACSGPVDAWLDCCDAHDPTGLCDNCGTKFPAWARFLCRTCKNHNVSSPKALALFHPKVVAFYENHGESTRIRADDPGTVRRAFDRMDDHRLTVVGTDVPRVEVTVSLDGDEIRLTFDETARVVEAAE